MGKAEPLTGAPGRCGGGEGVGKGESLGLLWAVGSPGELLPTRAFWGPPHTHTHNLCHLQEPRLDVKRMPQCLLADCGP